ncbi:NDR1/HIN1-like protein 10 [Cajanus cajan]|uniref:NDR1/HIN1-like protein 10 n=1 Tax=Cajanus cajan TaxID=3821 RepID=UPI00098D9A51|nr:NDR1/HIN1-like protein 10 [Cajanus cajan]
MKPIVFRILACIAFIACIVVMTLFIIFSVVKPKLPEFRVDSASLTVLNLNNTEPYLTATWNVTLVITNPNHNLAIAYDAVSASVMYGNDAVLARTLLQPFLQKSRSDTALQIHCAVVNEFLHAGLAAGLASDRANGSVQFGLAFWALISYRAGIFQSSDYRLKANCNALRFAFSPQDGTGALLNSFLC